MGGPRLQWQAGRVAPYAQMLFGLARIASSMDFAGETFSAAQNNFGMAPGGGVDIRFSDRGAMRAGASLRAIRADRFMDGSERYTYYEFQVIAGVVFR